MPETARSVSPLTIGLAAVIVLLGSYARFHELGHDGLWNDELFTSSMVLQHPLLAPGYRRTNVVRFTPDDSFLTAKGAEQSPPLFEILTKGSVTLFGVSEWSLRLVSAISGCLWLLYLGVLACRTRDARTRRAYLIALLFGAVSASFIDHDQEARAYGLGALLTGIVAAQLVSRLIEGIETAPLPRPWELVVFVLACHTHYNALVFCGIVLTFYVVVARRVGRWAEAKRLFVVPLACVPWITLNAHTVRFTYRGGAAWYPISVSEALLGAVKSTMEVCGTSLFVIGLVALWISLGRRVLAGEPEDGPLSRTLRAITLIVSVYVFVVALVTMRAGMMHARYYIFALPLIQLAVGLALAHGVTRRALLGLVLVPFVVGSVAEVRDYYASERDGYREITRWLRGHVRPDAAILYPFTPNISMYRYYLHVFFDAHADERAVSVPTIEEAGASCARLGDAREVAVIGHGVHRPLLQAALDACSARYRVTHELEVMNVVGQVWERR